MKILRTAKIHPYNMVLFRVASSIDGDTENPQVWQVGANLYVYFGANMSVQDCAHEATHLKQFIETWIEERKGFSCEAEAYLVGWLTEVLWQWVNQE